MTTLAPLPPGRPARLVYLGTPEMAVAPLDALVSAGFEIGLVVTRIDKRRGRGSEVGPSPVKLAAQRLLIPVSHQVEDALGVGADLGVVVAFGQLIREPVLAQLPMINLHFSLLPRWRGAAPVERAVLAGDDVTGVCLMQLEVGLDTGPILDRAVVAIDHDESVEALRHRLVETGSTQLVANLTSGRWCAQPQVGEPTYAAKLDPAEFRIDWNCPARHVQRLVRLGVAWTTFRGKRLKILSVSIGEVGRGDAAAGSMIDGVTVGCADLALTLGTVQPEGKPVMTAAAWAHGARPASGEQLGGQLGGQLGSQLGGQQ